MSDEERIDCEEALRRLAAYLDRELPRPETEEMERHLERCRSCYSRAEFERRLRDRLRSDLQVTAVPPEFEARIRSLLGDFPEAS